MPDLLSEIAFRTGDQCIELTLSKGTVPGVYGRARAGLCGRPASLPVDSRYPGSRERRS